MLSSKISYEWPRVLSDHCNLHLHMLLMEGNRGSETQRRPPPPPPAAAADTGCDHHLTRSNSDASSLTAENCQGFFRSSNNLTPDECTAWTNDKHNSYLYQMEMSFVEQLYQSKSVHERCSEHNLGDNNLSRMDSDNLNDASDKYNVFRIGSWQKVCAVGESIPCSASAEYHASLESKRTHHPKHKSIHGHPSPAKLPAFLKHKGTWKQGKGRISHGRQTCTEDSTDLTREGTGQNFADDDYQTTLDFESHAKRSKAASGDGSLQDQIGLPVNDFQQNFR